MRSWSHGHSIGVGLIVGLSLAAHAWLFIIGGIVLGFVGRDVWAIRKRVIAHFNRTPVVVQSRRERW